jgi:hypothetical protein
MELRRRRDFELLLQEDLADRLYFVRSLWRGEVTLPRAPGAYVRYRLVVAEYEEYLVDDDRPYNLVPGAKGCRLVFVGLVELY